MYVKTVTRLLKKKNYISILTITKNCLVNIKGRKEILIWHLIKHKKEYQLKIIAIAEIVSEKYKENDLINVIIDYSNSQKEVKQEAIEISEEQINKNIELLNKDKEVELGNRSAWKRC